jgi:hypothetical protein
VWDYKTAAMAYANMDKCSGDLLARAKQSSNTLAHHPCCQIHLTLALLKSIIIIIIIIIIPLAFLLLCHCLLFLLTGKPSLFYFIKESKHYILHYILSSCYEPDT